MVASLATLEELTRRAALVGSPVARRSHVAGLQHALLAGDGGLSGSRVLPVAEPLDVLLPWGGLRRGDVVTVAGSTYLALALAARTSADGAWCAVVGVPGLGLAAAGEAGMQLERLALVPHPGCDWPAVVAALVDAFDVVALRPSGRLQPADGRQLQARARERGTVVLTLHDEPAAAGLDGAQLRLTVVSSRWEGVGDGHGHLQARLVEVRAEGRGAAARPRTLTLWLPGVDAPVAAVRESPRDVADRREAV